MMKVPFCVISGTSPKKTSCSFDVADGAIAGLGVFVENGEAHGDLERRGVSHATLFALGHVIFQLQADGVAALVAEIRRVGVVGAALLAEHVARDENGSVMTVLPQFLQVVRRCADPSGGHTCTPSYQWRNPQTQVVIRCGSR